jgi:opacity protein-like surface antigen
MFSQLKLKKMTAKYILLSLFCMCLVSICVAQSDSITKAPRFEVGVNGTSFFKQFLNISLKNSPDTATSILETPYYLTSKFKLKKGYLRVGMGVKINSENTSSSKTADYKINNNNDYQLRIGYERQRKLNKKCSVYYGVDALGGLNDLTIHANSGFDFVTISDRSWMMGLAPVAGFHFKLWENIALSTETSIRYRYTIFGESAKFSKNADFNEKGLSLKTQKLDFLPPSVIYVTFLF